MAEPTRVTRVLSRAGREVRVVRAARLASSTGERGRMARPLYRVGAHESNDLVLRDETVSKHHLEIAALPDGWRIADLGSANGTRLVSSEARLGEVTVAGAIELELGRVRVRFEPESREAEVEARAGESFGTLVGRSVAMRELYAQLERVAPSEATVLLEGETGAGKEAVAEALHAASARAGGPFVVIDCAALSGELLESELYGHVRGAFSGAERDRVGLLESAAGGTVLLDEIGELPLVQQKRLLGALERRSVTPVGSSTPRPLDVRIVAATHRELPREVNAGRFRADLFYRLAVVRLRVPPLRERLDDVPLLVASFLAPLRQTMGGQVPKQLSAVALARLAAQPWPGNVRELRNAVERAVLQLRPSDEAPAPPLAPPTWVAARDAFLDRFERAYLVDLLRAAHGNVSEAARQAGVERRHIQRLVRRHAVSPRDFSGG